MRLNLESPLGKLTLVLSEDGRQLEVGCHGKRIYRGINFNTLRVSATRREDGSCRLGPLTARTKGYYRYSKSLDAKDRKVLRDALYDIIVEWWDSPQAEEVLKQALVMYREALKMRISGQERSLKQDRRELKSAEKTLTELADCQNDPSALHSLLNRPQEYSK